MKNKYERLMPEEKKEAEIEFLKYDREHNNYAVKYTKLKRIGWFGVIYAVIATAFEIYGIVKGGNVISGSIFGIVVDCLLLLVCTFFIVQSDRLLKYQINQYLIMKAQEKRKKEKEEEERKEKRKKKGDKK